MMKLRNKETGQIYNACCISFGESLDGLEKTRWKTLKEFNEDWEDVEEPKEYWFINDLDGEPIKCELKSCGKSNFTKWSERRKQIGNYFETEEEAERAVEKLKAWKRLKDKGVRFDGYDSGHNSNKELCGQAYFKAGNFWFDIKADLDLLFGGEE